MRTITFKGRKQVPGAWKNPAWLDYIHSVNERFPGEFGTPKFRLDEEYGGYAELYPNFAVRFSGESGPHEEVYIDAMTPRGVEIMEAMRDKEQR